MGADSISPVRGRYLIFQLADRTYAIPIGDVEEVIPAAELSTVPGAPPFLAGFLNVGGQPIPVASLRRLLGISDLERELYAPLIVLNANRQQVAIEVDSVVCISEIDNEQLVPLAEGCSFNDWATGIARIDGRAVILLSPERLLLDQERRRMAELIELERQKLAELTPVIE